MRKTRHRLFAASAGVALVAALAACAPANDEPDPDDGTGATQAPDDGGATETAGPDDGQTTAPGEDATAVPGDDQTTSAPPAPEANGTVEDVEVEVDEEGVPTISLPETPFVVAETARSTVEEGDGAEVEDGQNVEVNYLAINGATGDTVESTYEAGTTVRIPLANPDLLPAFLDQLPGATVGESLVLAMTAEDGFGLEGAEALGVGPQDSLVFYIDILDASTPLTQAEGEEVTDLPEGLPTVEADGVEPAVITIPEGEDPPTDLTVQPLIEGEGATVEGGQTVSVNYTGVSWDTGEQFDSNLAMETPTPFSFPLGQGQVIPGWDEGLVGQPVGSRVLMVIPPDMAYGTDGGHELAGQTLVFVVDILDAQ